jgi:hypothetical protein
MDVESNSPPLKVPLDNDQDVQDATDLAGMGHAQALTRKFSIWSMLALAFCVLGMLFECFFSRRSRPRMENWARLLNT